MFLCEEYEEASGVRTPANSFSLFPLHMESCQEFKLHVDTDIIPNTLQVKE